jgi:hypothetical protein
MADAHALDPLQLEKLCQKFEEAAYSHPTLDAVVVYRPDLRLQETERQARNWYFKEADTTSENSAVEFAKQTRSEYEVMRSTRVWEDWIPPTDKNIMQLGAEEYWTRIIRSNEYPEFGGPPARCDLWKCTLFGPAVRNIENVALRLFNVLAGDAARLIFPNIKAKGTPLLSRWLVYLADRPDPIGPDSTRKYLSWPESKLLYPTWGPVTPQNAPTSWWAVRLPNVFELSREAIADLANRAPAPSPLRMPKIKSAGRMEWKKKGPLKLTFDTNLHTVERNNKRVEFKEHGRPWEVLLKLADRYPNRYLVQDLGRDVWNPNGNEIDPYDTVVQKAISAIRRLLKPLGVGVANTRKLGYILAELAPTNRPRQAKNRTILKARKMRKP